MAHKEKVCQEQDCLEQWENLTPEARDQAGAFIYCPFCAMHMITRCSECGEALNDQGFKFCPWCGSSFED